MAAEIKKKKLKFQSIMFTIQTPDRREAFLKVVWSSLREEKEGKEVKGL